MSDLANYESGETYKDRATGLVVFGILTILIGGVCLLVVPLMIFALTMSKSGGGNFQTIYPAVAFYGLMAVALVWLGIGSIMKRRWARALLLVGSWSWLAIGVIAIVMMAVLLPQTMEQMREAGQPGQPQLPASAMWVIMIIQLVVMGGIFVALPAVWVFFYRSRHVKATCEHADPVVRWTDRCPLPVLGASLWLAFGTLTMLPMILLTKSVLPLFGMFVTGAPAVVGLLILAALWAFCAWGTYRLDPRVWWLVVAMICLSAASMALTYSRHDIMELYYLMGYPEQQIEEIRKFKFITGSMMTWGMLLWVLPTLGYLVFIKKYFKNKAL